MEKLKWNENKIIANTFNGEEHPLWEKQPRKNKVIRIIYTRVERQRDKYMSK